MKLILFILTSILLLSCNQPEIKGATPPVVEAPLEIKNINILGFNSVKTTVKDGSTFVFFEPFIPRDDTPMS